MGQSEPDEPPIDPEAWRRIRDAYADLTELPEAEWNRALDERGVHDPAVRERVLRLLDRNPDAGGFMAHATLHLPTQDIKTAEYGHGRAPEPDAAPGTALGPYRIVSHIAEGTFGHVYLAQQEQPLRRQVALKILKAGMDSRAIRARFEQERQTLAQLSHPNIAAVFDAGTSPTGRPYFAMELVHGLPVTKFCDQHRLPIEARLQLFLQVCSAVQHSHTKGVLHRDLKPSNVLACGGPSQPTIKVIDFGIAKLLDPSASGGEPTTLMTERRQLIGTPEYMSPEQVRGGAGIDARSDIYALGAILYELLTGFLPLDSQRLRSASMTEMERIICDEEPPPCAMRIQQQTMDVRAQAAEHRGLGAEQLERALRADLTWIALKALDKDPSRRYETPTQLAEDILRHLQGEPVQAAPPSTMYRVRKYVRRRKGLVTAASLMVLLLVAGLLSTIWWAGIATARADEASRNLRKSEAARLASASMLAGASHPQLRVLLAAEAVAKGCSAEEAASSVCVQALLNALAAIGGEPLVGHEAPLKSVAFSPDGTRVLTSSLDGTARVFDLSQSDPSASALVLRGHAGGLNTAVFSPDGLIVATAGKDGTARLWNLRDRDPSATQRALPVHAGAVAKDSTDQYVNDVAFSPDGNRVVTACRDGVIKLWDVRQPEAPVHEFHDHTKGVTSARISPDGQLLLSHGVDGWSYIWDINSALSTPVRRAAIRHGIESWKCKATFGADSKTFTVAGARESVLSMDGTDLNVIFRSTDPDTGINHAALLALHPSKPRFAFCHDKGGKVEVHSTASATPTRPMQILDAGACNIEALVFSADGRWLAAGADDNVAYVWDMERAESVSPTLVLRGHDKPVISVAFDPAGTRLATASTDGTARIWNLGTGAPHDCIASFHEGPWIQAYDHRLVMDLQMCQESRNVLVVRNDGQCHLWDWMPRPPNLTCTFGVANDPMNSSQISIAFDSSLDRGTVALLERIGDARQLQVASFKALGGTPDCPALNEPIVIDGRPSAIAISSDGRRAAVALLSGDVHLLDLSQEPRDRFIRTFSCMRGELYAVSFSPDGDLLVTAGADGVLRLWDISGSVPTLHQEVARTREYIRSVSFSPAGDRLLCAGADHMIHVFRVGADARATPWLDLRGHTDWVVRARFDSTGSRIASASQDGTARIWDLDGPSPSSASLVLRDPSERIGSVSFSMDGQWLATAGEIGSIRIWPIGMRNLCECARRAVRRDMAPEEWAGAFPGQPYEKSWVKIEAACALAPHR